MMPHLVELSGAPLTHLEYAKRLRDRGGFDVTFVVPGEGPLTDQARAAGLAVEVVENPPGGVSQQPGVLAKAVHFFKRREAKNRLAEYLERTKPDIVFASSVVSAVPAQASIDAGVRCVYHLQEPAASFPDTPLNRQKVATIRQACPFLFAAPGSHARMFEGARLVEVHNAIDPSRYDLKRRAGCRAKLQAEMGWPAKGIIIACIASLTHRKGIDALWEASYDLFFRHPDMYIFVAGPEGGDPEFAAKLKREIRESDFAERFRLLGQRGDVPDLLLGSDIFVLPSRADAQPLALLEAMAAGLPVVTTDVGDIPRVLLEGQIGFVLPAADLMSLQVGIEKILDVPDVRLRYKQGAVERSMDFTYDKAVDIVAGELAKLAGKS